MSLAAWAWSTMIVLLVLLLISSCARAWVTPEIPTVAIFEILIELATLGYLVTPSVRRAFGRT